MTGNKEDGDLADCGAGAIMEHVGPGPETGRKEVNDAAAEETMPISSETALSEFNVRKGSIEGAGEKMSDWNELDLWCGPSCQSIAIVCLDLRVSAYFARDDERHWFDGTRCELVRSCDLAFRRFDCLLRNEAHPALRAWGHSACVRPMRTGFRTHVHNTRKRSGAHA